MPTTKIQIRCSETQYHRIVTAIANYATVTTGGSCVLGEDTANCPLSAFCYPLPCRKCVESAVRWINPNGKKPVRESLADRNCPTCGAGINFDALNDRPKDAPLFCSHCGQKFDWSDEPGWEEY